MGKKSVWTFSAILITTIFSQLAMGSTVAKASKTLLPVVQKKIDRVEMMPNLPQPFKMRDWNKVAKDLDSLVFDLNAKGDFFPLIWIDKGQKNFAQDTFGIYSFVGDNRQGPQKQESHEGIVALGAVLGGTLAGIDKSNQNGINFVQMCENYFNKDNGRNIVMNATNAANGSFWYDIFPNIIFNGITYYYPKVDKMEEIMKTSANSWYEASKIMGGNKGIPNFAHSYFDFKKMVPVDNDLWAEPDSSAGIAWLQYMAYSRWKDKKYLQGADWGMKYLQGLPEDENPLYEVILPYGFYTATRMNAELGRNYDAQKILNWCFDGMSSARPAWGVIAEKWGKLDAFGLQGSITDMGGYAFAMNTFNMASPLVPAVRYDARYARTIGKWMLNAANNARLFYPEEIPAESQTCAEYKAPFNNLVTYEGLRKQWGLLSPYAMGDARKYGWAKTDFGLYGSVYVGIFGGIISRTNDEKILKLDCLKTDYFRAKAYPTFLYYNPYKTSKLIDVDNGKTAYRIYDTVSKKFLTSDVKGKVKIKIPADSAVVAVTVPAGVKTEVKNNRLLANGVIIDYKLK